jgi:lipopolysaccharide transport system permease protein
MTRSSRPETGEHLSAVREQPASPSQKSQASAASSVETLPEIVFTPPKGWLGLNVRELWTYRELLYFLVWRDIKVRYKQTVLGVAWAVLQPLLTMVVFSIFFGVLGRMSSEGLPYPVFFYAALVPWTYFSSCVRRSSDSLVGSSSLISKVYFPRLVLPLASVLSSLVDFGFAFLVLLVLLLFYRLVPTWSILLLPLYLLLALVTGLGVGLWLSALNVRYRDFQFVVPFLIQTWFFVTPIIYPSTLIPEAWRAWYGLNPMVGVVEGFRGALLSTSSNPGPIVGVSALVSVVLLLSGAFYFRRMEHTFADVV